LIRDVHALQREAEAHSAAMGAQLAHLQRHVGTVEDLVELAVDETLEALLDRVYGRPPT
jgi:hypothetical protein